MKKHILSAFLITSLLLTACGTDSSVPSVPSSDTSPDSTVSSSPADPASSGNTQTLEAFDSIEIDVLAADIRVITGDEWAVSYHFSDKEPIKCLEVRAGKLNIETSFDPTEYFDRSNDWFVTVTIPEGTELKDIELETISGNVEADGFTCRSIKLETASGTVNAENITARNMELKSISSKVNANAISVSDLEASTISDDLTLSGDFGELDVNSASGKIDITGSISAEGEIETVSSDITLTVNQPISLQAGSAESITINGEKVGNSIRTNDGVPVKVGSISGKIDIQINA